jgi:hypothetical protein
MSSIFAKLACSSNSTLMEGKELIYYFNFLKDEFKSQVGGVNARLMNCLFNFLKDLLFRTTST